ncbi:MAG: hypothetical protein HN429_01930 [Candidatus Magasanikbacteria bacterium]|jgi:hypothetical protein|nr:hypothetical protein [Candidatus Magasanikbacteria bacterium]
MHQAIKRQLTSWLFAINSNKRSLLLSALFVGCIVIGLFLFGDAALAVDDAGGSLDVDLGAFNSPANWFIRILSEIMLAIGELCITLTTFALEFLIRLAQYNDFSNAPPVLIGWFMIRDLANMFFVVALLVIAFGTILGLEQYEWKKALGKLVIAAILINFSKLIAQIIIDAAHVVTITFLNAIASTAGGNIINMFGLDDLYKITNTIPPEQLAGQGLRLDLFVASFMIMMFSALVLITIGVYFLLLLIRMVVLWTLIIISPFAYILQILPQTKSYAQEYWKEFINHVILAPMMVFFLWLAFASFGSGTIAQELQIDPTSAEQAAAGTVVTGLNNGAVIQSPTASLSAGTTWENMANLAIAIAFLLMGIERVQKLGVKGGSLLSNVTKFGKYVAAIGSGYVVGRGAYELGKKGTKAVVGKAILPVAKKLSGYNALKHQVHKGALQAYRGLRNTPYAGRLFQSGDRRKGEIEEIQTSIDDQSKRYKHEGSAKAFNSDEGIAREAIRRKAAKEVKDGAEKKSEAELKLRILSDYSDRVDDRVSKEKNKLEADGTRLTAKQEKALRKKVESQVAESPGFRSGEAKHFKELSEAETVKEDARLAEEKTSGYEDKVFYQKKLQKLLSQRGEFGKRYKEGMTELLKERAEKILKDDDTLLDISEEDITSDKGLAKNLIGKGDIKKREKKIIAELDKGAFLDQDVENAVLGHIDQINKGEVLVNGADGSKLKDAEKEKIAIEHVKGQAGELARESLIKDTRQMIELNEISFAGSIAIHDGGGDITDLSELGQYLNDRVQILEEDGEFDEYTDKEKIIEKENARQKIIVEVKKNTRVAAIEHVARVNTTKSEDNKEISDDIDKKVAAFKAGGKYEKTFDGFTREFIDERVASLTSASDISEADARAQAIEYVENNSERVANREINAKRAQKRGLKKARKKATEGLTKADRVKVRLEAIKGLNYFEAFEAAGRGGQKTGKQKSETERLTRQVGDILRIEENKGERKLREWENSQYKEELEEYALKDFPQLFRDIKSHYSDIKNLKVKESDGSITQQEETDLKNARQNQMRSMASAIARGYGNFLGEYLASFNDTFKEHELNDPKELHKVLLGLASGEDYKSFDSAEDAGKIQEKLRKDLKEDKSGLLFRNLLTSSSKAASDGQWQFYAQFGDQIDEFGDRKVGFANIAQAGLGGENRLGTGGDTDGMISRHNSQTSEALVNHTFSSSGDGRTFVKTKTKKDGSKLSTGFHNDQVRAAALGITQLRGKKAVTKEDGSVFNFLSGGTFDKSTYDKSKNKFVLTDEQTEIKDFWGEAISIWERDFNRSTSPAQKDNIVSAILEIMNTLGVDESTLNFYDPPTSPGGKSSPRSQIWAELKNKFK